MLLQTTPLNMKAGEKKIVICNGAYDVIHMGHLALLNHAKSLGDYLIVALDTDARIRKVKGNDRPFNDQDTRKNIMENFHMVDEVILFDSDEELINIFKRYNTDVRVIGADWKHKPIVGSDCCGELVFFEHEIKTSSSKRLQNYIQNLIWT